MSTKNIGNKPTTLIVYGANIIGQKLSELLTTQKSNIIVVDEFTKSTREPLRTIKKDHDAHTFDISGIAALTEDIKRLDYICILLDQYLTRYPRINNKQFLSVTNTLDTLFKFALEQGAKVVVTSSIEIHRHIAGEAAPQGDSLKDLEKKGSFSRTELQKYCENLAAEYHDQALLNVRITRVGELMGEGIPTDNPNMLTTMLTEAVTKPRISIPGEGLDYAYYVHHLDAVYGIIKSLFSNKTNGEVFSLSYPEEISSLNLAYKILELTPKASEIVFSEAEDDTKLHHVYVPAKNLSKIGWEPKIPFEEALIETVSFFHKTLKVPWDIQKSSDKPKTESSTSKPRSLRSESMTPLGKALQSATTPVKRINEILREKLALDEPIDITWKRIAWVTVKVALASVLFFGLIAPVLQVVIGTAGTAYYGKKGYEHTMSLETDQAKTELDKTKNYASLAHTGWQSLRWISVIPQFSAFYENTQNGYSAILHLSNGGYYLVEGFDPYASYFKKFEPITSFGSSAGGGSRAYVEELEGMADSVPYIESASVEISLARDALEAIDTTVYPEFISSYLKDITSKAQTAEEGISLLEGFAYYLPELLGRDGRKTYVVLFQNPMELRSTGGWLTSVALVGVEYGQVREMEVKDVYDIDGQIQQSISPPASMARALDISEWTLSLSNWSPDFPQSAEAAEYFLKEADEVVRVDGVIAIDLEFIRSLLEIWGEVNVPGEATPITADNLYDKVIEIHRSFTPGSTQKPVFLSNLANEILSLVLSSPTGTWTEIAKRVGDGLEEKHVLVNIHNSEITDILNSQNWSGRIGTRSNTVFPVEWNWGSNKANYFLSRSYFLKATIINTETVQHTLTITYENDSTVDAYPEGNYHNYLRVYLPSGAEVTRTEGIDSPALNRDADLGYDILTGWVDVPISSTKTIEVSYRLAKDSVNDNFLTDHEDTITYFLNFVKQPGTDADPLTIEISYPEGWEPTELTNVHRELDSLIQRTELSGDIEFSITWQK